MLLLNQPHNLLINHLGKGSFWITPTVTSKKNKYILPFSILHFSKIFRILLISGVSYKNHPFFNNIFFKKLNFYSLPILYFTESFSKFYREIRLKITINQGAKKNLILKKMLVNINISDLKFYKKANAIIATLITHLPIPYKRNFLKSDNIHFFKKYDLSYKKIQLKFLLKIFSIYKKNELIKSF